MIKQPAPVDVFPHICQVWIQNGTKRGIYSKCLLSFQHANMHTSTIFHMTCGLFHKAQYCALTVPSEYWTNPEEFSNLVS